MFDIDKMYVMMASYNPVISSMGRGKLNDYLYKKLKGQTKEETLANIRELFSEDSEFTGLVDAYGITEDIQSTSNELISKGMSELVDGILSGEFKNTEFLETVFKELAIDTERLVYETKEGTDGYYSNMLIDAYKTIFANKNTIADVMTPIDIEFFKNEINDLTRPEKDYSTTSLLHMEPFAEVDTSYDYRAGKAGVGIEANAMVDISRLGDMVLENITFTDHINIKNKKIQMDAKKSKNLSEKDLKEYIEDMKLSGDKLQGVLNEIVDVDIMTSMVAILNAFVDIAKDPYITRGNWLTSTTNIGNTLLRMGMHPLRAISILAQPAVKLRYGGAEMNGFSNQVASLLQYKYAHLEDIQNSPLIKGLRGQMDKEMQEYIDSHGLEFDADFNKSSDFLALAELIKNDPDYEMIKEYAEVLEVRKNPQINHFEDSSLRDLRVQVKKRNALDIHMQLGILDVINEVSDINEQMKLNIQVSKLDTDGPGASIANMAVINNTVEELESPTATKNVLKGFKSKLDGTVLGAYYDNMNDMYSVAQKNPVIFPEASYASILTANIISSVMLDTKVLDTKVLDAINNTLYSKMMYDFFELTPEVTENLIDNFPDEFIRFKSENLDKYLILSELDTKMTKRGDNNLGEALIHMTNRKRSPLLEEKLISSFEQIIKDHPEFGDKLVKYSYATTNFKFTSGQFYSLIPTSYYINKDVTRFVRTYSHKHGSLLDIITGLFSSSKDVANSLLYVSHKSFNKGAVLTKYPSEKEALQAFEDVKKEPVFSRSGEDLFLLGAPYVFKNGIYRNAYHLPTTINSTIDNKSINVFGRPIEIDPKGLDLLNTIIKNKTSLLSQADNLSNQETSMIAELLTNDLESDVRVAQESKFTRFNAIKEEVRKSMSAEDYSAFYREFILNPEVSEDTAMEYLKNCLNIK